MHRPPGAVVSLMDRTNVETVIVAGKQLEASRDYVFDAASIEQDLFGSN